MSTHRPENSSARRPDPDDVRYCHKAGMSRNRTAKVLGVSTRQVDRVAEELGISWSSHATADAVAARKSQAEGQRVELAELWLELAVDSVGRALVEECAGERRRHAMTAEAATRSEINIWRSLAPEIEEDSGAQAYDEMLLALKHSFAVIKAIPDDVLDPTGEFESKGLQEKPP